MNRHRELWFNPFVKPASQKEWKRIQRGKEGGREIDKGWERVIWFCQILLWHLGQANTLNGMQTDLLRAFREANCLSSDCHILRACLVTTKAFLNPFPSLPICQCNPFFFFVSEFNLYLLYSFQWGDFVAQAVQSIWLIVSAQEEETLMGCTDIVFELQGSCKI